MNIIFTNPRNQKKYIKNLKIMTYNINKSYTRDNVPKDLI